MLPRLVLLAAAFATAYAAQGPSTFDAISLERVLGTEMRDTHTPGAAIAIVRGNEVLMARGYGRAAADSQAPVTPDTLFRIGSTTKMFTGLSAVLVAGDGALAFDRPIGATASDLAPPIATLTLDALLTHRAGVINEASADGPHDDDALGRRIRAWGSEHLFAPPGDVYSYSSPGYWLAGYVVERAAGRPFADVVAERILRPLGMSRSTFRPLMALTYPMAQDHRVAGTTVTVTRPFPDDASTWPGGSLFSSASELARFAIALLNEGRLDGRQALPADAVRTLFTRHTDTFDGCGYTYGLSDCTRGGVRVLSHYGFRSGSGSVVTLVPDRRIGIVVLANRNGGIFGRTEAAALRMLAGIEPARAEPAAAPRALAQPDITRLAGRYENGPDVLTLTARDGGLTYRYQDGAEQPVKALSDRELVVTNAQGQPVQPFLVLTGRLTGTLYLSDGISAFRKTR